PSNSPRPTATPTAPYRSSAVHNCCAYPAAALASASTSTRQEPPSPIGHRASAAGDTPLRQPPAHTSPGPECAPSRARGLLPAGCAIELCRSKQPCSSPCCGAWVTFALVSSRPGDVPRRQVLV